MSNNRRAKLHQASKRSKKLHIKEKIIKNCLECGKGIPLDSKTEIPLGAGIICPECGAKKETPLTL